MNQVVRDIDNAAWAEPIQHPALCNLAYRNTEVVNDRFPHMSDNAEGVRMDRITISVEHGGQTRTATVLPKRAKINAHCTR